MREPAPLAEGAADALRFDVPSAAQLMELATAPLPPALRVGAPTRTLYRELYLDTADGALRRRGVTCRLRLDVDDRRVLSLRVGTPPDAAVPVAPRVVAAPVRAAEPAAALAEDTAPGRRLRAIVDPALLEVRVALEVERWTRTACPDWLRRPRLELHFDRVTVRRGTATRGFQQLCVHRRRGDGPALEELATALEHGHGLRRVAAGRRERAELLLKWMQSAEDAPSTGSSSSQESGAMEIVAAAADDALLDPELSQLAFQERVLALAEDAATPLGERLRFLAIVGGNLDEFFAVRVAGLKAAAAELLEEQAPGGLQRRAQLQAIARRAAALVERHYRCWRACAEPLAAHGVRVVPWTGTSDAGRARLRERFREEIHSALTPMAMTLSPGHPFPRLPHLSLSLAVVLRDRDQGPSHFAEVEIPEELPRFLDVERADGGRDLVPVEEVIRANLDVLYPNTRVEQAYPFRVTRGEDLGLVEDGADDLLEAVSEATSRRTGNGAVRLEVERGMPAVLRELVLDELRREPGAAAGQLGDEDVYEIDGLLDLRRLGAIALPAGPATAFPPFRPGRPVPRDRPMLAAIAEGDLLVHHPFESFEHTVVRFLREAAADDDVTAIKITLYRVGDCSPVGDALVEAARRGKSVAALVELKARADEARNVRWARALAKAGGHVIYGLVGLKTHAKVALVVRREGERLRRYVHVGTGNYDTRAGLHYTDLSLFSADDDLAADVTDLFNGLTGSSAPPARLPRGALVAPGQLLPALLAEIEREAAHARAGRPARIRIKVNGLSDGDVVRALRDAARDGVRVELAVRGICTLRPDATGNLRVVATVGRFLEHSRIYAFDGDGAPHHYIGSSDLRARNLRHRVELLVPVRDPVGRETLDRVLDLYLNDPTAWELTATGEYVRRTAGEAMGAQEELLRELAREVGWREEMESVTRDA